MSAFTLLHRVYRGYVQAPEHPGKGRVEKWLSSWMLPPGGAPFGVKAGVRMFLHPDDYIEYLLIKTGEYEPVTLDFVRKNLKAGDRAFFAGVNFGLHVVMASSCVGAGGLVVGIEPQPGSLCRTLENLKLNGLENNVALYSGALGAARDLLPMDVAPSFNTGLATLRESKNPVLRVNVLPVEEIARHVSCLQPRLFLIDVEGFEEMVLAGFGGSFRPELLIVKINREILGRQASGEAELFQKIVSYGYEIHDFRGRRVAAGDDLIEANVVAVRRDAVPAVWV